MTSSASTYPDWKAPADDGEILIWPEPPAIASQTIENQKRLSASDVKLHGVPLGDLRRSARNWIGHTEDNQPLIASGHQTELYHPGVWAKDVLAHHLAGRVGGQGFHFAVDTDSPKHLHLRWPRGSEPITDDPALRSADWTGLLDAPSPSHLRQLESRIGASGIVGDFLSSLRRLAIESPKLSPALTNATHELDWSLGLRHHAMVTSPIWMCEPYLIYVHQLIADAPRFAQVYNSALSAYRTANKVRSSTRPMPDLAISGDSIELPMWLDHLATGQRSRPKAVRRGDQLVLEGFDFAFNPTADASAGAKLGEWLRANELRLAPRALTLTMFLRLIVVDQFIHGIGGARYDQITDSIIEKYFGISPPAFCVTTATMYLPEAIGQARACVTCVKQDGHRLRHSLLGEKKRELVAQIVQAPRGSAQRTSAFYEMHRQLSEAAINHPLLRQWEASLEETRRREAEESALFDRELFYAMQPRDRLLALVERYAALQ